MPAVRVSLQLAVYLQSARLGAKLHKTHYYINFPCHSRFLANFKPKSKMKENWSWVPVVCLTQRQTGRVTVGLWAYFVVDIPTDGLSASLSWSKSRRTHDHILLSRMRLPNLSKSKSYTTDGQSASPSWYQAPIWDPRPIFLLLSLIIFRQLRVCWRGAPTLTRSRVSNFQFLLGIASAAFLRFESHGTHKHILLSLFVEYIKRSQNSALTYILAY
jgi:hypothetical protein